MTSDPRRAYRVVDMFEEELAEYTGAPYAVAVDSCTNALFLSLMWASNRTGQGRIELPKRTYVGVLQAARNSGYEVEWWDDDWQRTFSHPWYCLTGGEFIVDSARYLARGMYRDVPDSLTCLSFHAAKQLALGRGGAILTDNAEAAEWFSAARMDGRPPGAPIEKTLPRGWHMPMPQEHAALGLSILSKWAASGYEPAPLPYEEYPDLSVL